MLLGTQFLELEEIAFGDLGQQFVAVVLDAVVLVFLIDGDESGLDQYRAVGPEHVTVGQRAGGHVDGHRVEGRRHHLAGHRALPDQRVEFHLVGIQRAFQRFRQVCDRGRADRFVRFLRILRLVLEQACLVRQVVLAVTVGDERAEFFQRDLRQGH